MRAILRQLDNRAMLVTWWVRSTAAAALLAACSPTLNWREVAVDESGLQALFPCKPERSAREMAAGARLPLNLLVCKAGDWTFAIGHADLGSTGQPGAALASMRAALVANAGGRVVASRTVSVPGMTAESQAQRIAVHGQGPQGGGSVDVEAAFFSRGSRLFQASVVGRGSIPSDVAQTFFEGLRWPAAQN